MTPSHRPKTVKAKSLKLKDIQKAINKANPGDTIELPPGVGVLNRPIRFKDRIVQGATC